MHDDAADPPPSPSPAGETLLSALAQRDLTLEPALVAQLDAYCRALWEWNEKINLTRHTTYQKFVDRDLLDSLAFARHLPPNQKVLDVGSGGGVPGLVLAILRPDLKVSLIDSVGKKARVLEDLAARLQLPVRVLHARVQDHLKEGASYDVLTVRAVAKLAELLSWLSPFWANFQRLLVLKGPAWVDERGEARHRGLLWDLELRRAESYPMPGTESESTLLELWRNPG